MEWALKHLHFGQNVIFGPKCNFGQNAGVLVSIPSSQTHPMKAKDCSFLVVEKKIEFYITLKVMRVSFKN